MNKKIYIAALFSVLAGIYWQWQKPLTNTRGIKEYVDCSPWALNNPDYERAKFIFRGIISHVSNDGLNIDVNHIWKGPPTEKIVHLSYGKIGRFRRQLAIGEEYIYFVNTSSGQGYVLDYCDYIIKPSDNPEIIKHLESII